MFASLGYVAVVAAAVDMVPEGPSMMTGADVKIEGVGVDGGSVVEDEGVVVGVVVVVVEDAAAGGGGPLKMEERRRT